jgi:hypothetical protein
MTVSDGSVCLGSKDNGGTEGPAVVSKSPYRWR